MMDVKIELNGEERGTIPYMSLATFTYFFRMNGYKVNWDKLERKIRINSPLFEKKVSTISNEMTNLHPLRNGKLESKIFKNIQCFLLQNKIDFFYGNEHEEGSKPDVYLDVSLLKISSLKEPMINLSHNLGIHRENWFTFFKNECREAGVMVTKGPDIVRNEPAIQIQIKYPEMSDDLFWEQIGESISLIISMAVLAYFQRDFSYIPLLLHTQDMLQNLFGNRSEQKIPPNEIQNKKEKTQPQVVFDYRLIINKNNIKKMKILANLNIKNNSNESLKNPIICLRVTPPGSLMVFGQLLPPKMAETLGVMSEAGVKGWKFKNDDWIKQLEETGEIWITPIQKLDIEPDQTESISNLQMDIQDFEEIENILIEAFVYFNQNQLKVAADNVISLSLKS
jgi:hypothetical protein